MKITVKSNKKSEFIDITSQIQNCVSENRIENGICMVFVPHTTAGITINESADPSVQSDIINVLNDVVPWEHNYKHMEGNSAAHVKSSIVGASELVSVKNSKLVLGTWQGIFFCEFDGPRTRNIHIQFIKE